MAHAEFAGWMSVVLTFPASLILNFVSAAVLGVRIGDSNHSFVALLACAALVNAAIIYALFMLSRRAA